MKLVGVLACPSFLSSANPMVARHAHLLRIVTTGVVWAAQDLILEVAVFSLAVTVALVVVMVHLFTVKLMVI